MDERELLIRRLLGQRVHVIIDRPMGYNHNGIVYPINYGYIPGVLAGDGEEQDAYILGVNTPLTEFSGQVVGAVRRKNDVEDKLVVAPEGMVFHQAQISEAVHFQEQYFQTTIDSLRRKSSGVLPFRRTGNGIEILLCYEIFSNHWSLPKGHMEAFETEEQTALRELQEETGLDAFLMRVPPVSEEYPCGNGAIKQVVYYLAEVRGEPRPLPGEISRFVWVHPSRLGEYLMPGTVAACKTLLHYL